MSFVNISNYNMSFVNIQVGCYKRRRTAATTTAETERLRSKYLLFAFIHT
jgi:hypothetical protein